MFPGAEDSDDGDRPDPPSITYSFCEAVELFTTLKECSQDAFQGLEWAVCDTARSSHYEHAFHPLGQVNRGCWEDVGGAPPGTVLLHGLPPGRHVIIRVLMKLMDELSGTCASDWSLAETHALPANHKSFCRDAFGKGLGGSRTICRGWVLFVHDHVGNSQIAYTTDVTRCFRCGGSAGSHSQLDDSALAQLGDEAGGEDYVVTVATYVNAFSEPDTDHGKKLDVFGRGDVVRVFEWDWTNTWRRCKCKCAEGGPQKYGWVKVLTWKYGPLLQPFGKMEKLKSFLHQDTSGVLRSVLEDMQEENVQKHVPDMLNSRRETRYEALRRAPRYRSPGRECLLDMSDGRLVLGDVPRASGSRQRCFETALVMGAHHTCTTALVRELEAQFFVTVENNYSTTLPDSRPENHKHLVLSTPPPPQDALVICLVKEPLFWLQSLTRNGATYAIYQLEEDPANPDAYMDACKPNIGTLDGRPQEEILDGILDVVEFMGGVYEDGGAARVWEATVRSYFDSDAYPCWRTAVVRSEDFLFRYDEVMDALAEIGLERRPTPPPCNSKPSKGGVVHSKTRGRDEALCWYGEPSHRWEGLEERHIYTVFDRLGSSFLDQLGYGEDAVSTWTQETPIPDGAVSSLYVAGTWSGFKPRPMRWDGDAFTYSLRVGKNGDESFQLLIEGDWEQVLYPNVPDGNPFVVHRLTGPDNCGHGKNWTIGRHPSDRARGGDVVKIDVSVDRDGHPKRVSWELIGR